MTAPFVPHTTGRSMPLDFFQLPQYVVLDLEEPILKYHRQIAEVEEYELSIDEVLSEALIFLADEWRADHGLGAFHEAMGQCFTTVDISPGDAEKVGSAAELLAKEMLLQVRQGHLYAADHLLHYRISKEWVDENTPVLERHLSIHHTKTG
jgi:hypothetical protein